MAGAHLYLLTMGVILLLCLVNNTIESQQIRGVLSSSGEPGDRHSSKTIAVVDTTERSDERAPDGRRKSGVSWSGTASKDGAVAVKRRGDRKRKRQRKDESAVAGEDSAERRRMEEKAEKKRRRKERKKHYRPNRVEEKKGGGGRVYGGLDEDTTIRFKSLDAAESWREQDALPAARRWNDDGGRGSEGEEEKRYDRPTEEKIRYRPGFRGIIITKAPFLGHGDASWTTENPIPLNASVRDALDDDYSALDGVTTEHCAAAKSCKPGLLMPVWEPQDVPTSTRLFRALVYLLVMSYLFYGISIVSDRFMCAIEVITSQERAVQITKVTGERITVLVHVWNETVSNLTLMALGSSAPEILLSVIEICGNNFEAGDLGPSTIVGSAAFNLFIIIAICIYTVPCAETRRIRRIDVFWVTAAFSTFAYVWLFIILSVFSPNVVEVWEGVLTFLFFPFTVCCAFWANKHLPTFGQRFIADRRITSLVRRSPPRMGAPRGFAVTGKVSSGSFKRSLNGAGLRSGINGIGESSSFLKLNGSGGDPAKKTTNGGPPMTMSGDRRRQLEIFRQLRAENPDLTLPELERLATAYIVTKAPKSRAFYRIQAIHKMMGSGDVLANKLRKRVVEEDNETIPLPLMPSRPKQVLVGFDPVNYMCLENVGTIELTVRADRGSLQVPTEVLVHYRTIEDTAQEHDDFIPTEGRLLFRPHETEKTIEIAIVDNDVYEDDEQFYVELFDLEAYISSNETQRLTAKLDASATTATVVIVDDDHGGAFSFNSEVFRVAENQGVLSLEVRRHRGARGAVTLPYKTIEGTAKDGTDYIGHDGELRFADGQTLATIEIDIVNDDDYEKSEDFYVELGAPVWHVKEQLGENGADGRPVLGAHRRCRVTIVEDKEFKNFVDKMLVNANTSFMVGSSSWKNQFIEALAVDDIDGDGSLSCKEKTLHYISLPWKLTFALIPPTDYYNGWLCFVVAIIMIGILTAIVGDVAALFGCTIGLKDSVTAITLVAMGTSLPDTFASMTAAVQDKTADSSVGNVTGSNAVNVFLGIGIAWALAAVVHAFRGDVFRVEAGTLATSVTLFLLGSLVCLCVLQWRRHSLKVDGEFGGPMRYKVISMVLFIGCWVVYILYNTLVAYCILPAF